MTIKYLPDMKVISEPLRPKPDEAVLGNFRKHQNEVGIASIVWHELLYGCFRLPESERRTAIETYHFEIIGPSIPILAYDERAAHWHASQRARLSSAGKTPPFADDQIAVIAAVDDLFLITFNTSGYEHFRGIQVEDWRD